VHFNIVNLQIIMYPHWISVDDIGQRVLIYQSPLLTEATVTAEVEDNFLPSLNIYWRYRTTIACL
jgi:hypothetical protein